jgi:hypothetical protein
MVQAKENGPRRGTVLAWEDVYQQFKSYADQTTFVGFSKRKSGISDSFSALLLKCGRKDERPTAMGKILFLVSPSLVHRLSVEFHRISGRVNQLILQITFFFPYLGLNSGLTP